MNWQHNNEIRGLFDLYFEETAYIKDGYIAFLKEESTMSLRFAADGSTRSKAGD